MRMMDISLENRPLERLVKHGAQVLSTAELLAVVLKTGSKGENVVSLSQRILSTCDLSTAGLLELEKIKGIGRAKASQVLALMEFSKRLAVSKIECKAITCAQDVYDYSSPRLNSLDREHVVVLHLDTKNKVVKEEVVSVGHLNGALMHPREVFKTAVRESSASIVLVHNHPSGDCTPSDEDIAITQKIIAAGELIGIKVLDHVIVGKGEWWSWREKQL